MGFDCSYKGWKHESTSPIFNASHVLIVPIRDGNRDIVGYLNRFVVEF